MHTLVGFFTFLYFFLFYLTSDEAEYVLCCVVVVHAYTCRFTQTNAHSGTVGPVHNECATRHGMCMCLLCAIYTCKTVSTTKRFPYMSTCVHMGVRESHCLGNSKCNVYRTRNACCQCCQTRQIIKFVFA